MSNTLRLRCISHDPPISSAEVGHNLSQLPAVILMLVDRVKICETKKQLGDDVWDLLQDDQYKRNTWSFLFDHPNCNIGIWDEYGRNHPAWIEGKEDERT